MFKTELFHARRSFHPTLLILVTVTLSAEVGLGDDSKSAAAQEAEQLAVLRSDAPAAEKAIACKKLAIYGSEAAVPDLAKLLGDPRLSSWSRISLEAIPGDAADEALRNASQSLEGRLLIGVINSIGVRRDEQAVELLTARLSDNDEQVASAAAVALGHIGNSPAQKALQVALAKANDSVREAVAEGNILVAERLHAAGESAAAASIYDEIRNADLSAQRIIEATRGAILARGDDGIPLLLEAFRSPDKRMFQLALGTAREFPGAQVDQALAKELATAAPPRAALLVQAMADRPETVVLDAVRGAAEAGEQPVRLSAIEALQRVGNASCLASLLQIAADSDPKLAEAAKGTLAVLPGEDINSKIVSMIPESKGATYRLLIELVGSRRIDAVPQLVDALQSSEREVRAAALTSLGETVPITKLSLLIDAVVKPAHEEDDEVAAVALRAASVRMPDRDACAEQLAVALDAADAETKTLLLEIISEVGGSRALETLATNAKSPDPELQDTSSRLLGKWNGVDAAPVLLDLAKTAPAEKFRIRALRGYIGLARKFAMPAPERAKMCEQALAVATRNDERQLVLEVLQLHPSVAGLKVAIAAIKTDGLEKEATAAVGEIAQKLRKKGVKVQPILDAAK